MNRLLIGLCAAVAALSLGTLARAQEDVYTLGFTGPGTLSGNEGDTASATYIGTLAHAGPGPGAQGWSFSVTADNATITSIAIAGTDAEALFSGGFEKSEVTPVDPVLRPSEGDCEGRDGAVSAVVLSFGLPIVLPPNATGTIAQIGLDATITDGGTCTLRYLTGGCRGSGQAVNTAVTQEGASKVPVLQPLEIGKVVVRDCCSAALNYGFSAGRVQSATPNDEALADESGICASTGGSIRVNPGTGAVYANISSDIAEGDPAVQGWSISLAYDGGGDIVSVTTANTDGANVPDGLANGGFEKTEVVDPAINGDQRGCVSAVVLSFGLPIVLPSASTASVLQVGVEGADGDEGSLKLLDGLRGSGQPVNNVITVGGGSGSACNKDTATVAIVFEPPPGKGPFVRGDPNADGRNNIADGIWIVNELFRSGQATSCQPAADVNGDGMIDLSDATYVFDYQFNGGPAPASPFPACGVEDFGLNDLNCDAGSAGCN